MKMSTNSGPVSRKQASNSDNWQAIAVLAERSMLVPEKEALQEANPSQYLPQSRCHCRRIPENRLRIRLDHLHPEARMLEAVQGLLLTGSAL